MSVNVSKEWYYFLRGREILLYKLLGGSSTERVTQSGVFSTRSHELMYPNEDIANGLRVEYTALNEPFIAESFESTISVLSGTSFIFLPSTPAFFIGSSDISFTNSSNTISGFDDTSKYFFKGQSITVGGTSSNNGTYTVLAVAGGGTSITVTEISASIADESNTSATFKTSNGAILGGSANTNTFTDFAANDKIRIQGSSSNDAEYTISSISENGDALIVSSIPSTLESAGERVTITQIPVEVASPTETAHINLNKMLSLAVVDYVKAMKADRIGELDKKEYYMKEFYSKLGDNESNIRKISMAFPSSPFAVR